MKPTHPYFTIFTPVYNGENHILRVFNSVLNQTFKNFEWIIINDGSTDQTESLLNEFKSKHSYLDITILNTPNLGKHFAFNKAIEMAKGVLFLPADADDEFEKETLQYFYEKWVCIDSKDKMYISGISVLCYRSEKNNIIGDLFPYNGIKTNTLELTYKYKIKGEKWGCLSTCVLKKYRLPIWNKGYVPESYLWHSIALNYYLIAFNIALRNYYYTPGSIMNSSKLFNLTPNKIMNNIKYEIWEIRNFGFYILRYDIKSFFKKFFIFNVLIVFYIMKSLRLRY